MTTRCSVCRHPARADIDAALTGGATASQVAREFGVHRSSVVRHTQSHVAAALARVVERSDDVPAHAIVRKATQLYDYCEALLDRAEALVQHRHSQARAITVTAGVIRETRATLVTVGRMIAETDPTGPPVAEPVDFDRTLEASLREMNLAWELADGTLEYSQPCRKCGYRPPPSGPLRTRDDHPRIGPPDRFAP